MPSFVIWYKYITDFVDTLSDRSVCIPRTTPYGRLSSTPLVLNGWSVDSFRVVFDANTCRREGIKGEIIDNSWSVTVENSQEWFVPSFELGTTGLHKFTHVLSDMKNNDSTEHRVIKRNAQNNYVCWYRWN